MAIKNNNKNQRFSNDFGNSSKNHINKGNQRNIMNRVLLLFAMLMFMCVPAFAQDDLILEYGFEEGGGSVAIDTSGYGNIGVLDNVGHDTTASKLRSGSYSAKFSNDDVITASVPQLQGTDLSFFTSYYKENNAGNNTIIDFVYEDSEMVELYYIDNGIQEFVLRIKDENGILQPITLNETSSGNILDNTKHEILLSLDFTANRVLFYLDQTLIHNDTYGFNEHTNLTNINLVKIGEALDFSDGMKGNLDDVRIYNFALDNTQAQSLFVNDTIEIEEDNGNGNNVTEPPEMVINGTQQYDLINTHYPMENDSDLSPISFQATMNQEATCDLYIDNEFVIEYENTLAFNTLIELSPGSHTYFLYCSAIDNNNILLFELTNITNFVVEAPLPSTITFVFSSNDFVVNNQPLFMVTPCLKKGISIPGGSVSKYSMLVNKDPVYFEPLENGLSQFTLPQGEHDFCLIHGIGQYSTPDDFSELWKINLVEKQTKIGDFDIPSNVTTTFQVGVDNFDIYEVYNPKAWGTSWVAIITSLIAFVIGLGLIYTGVQVKEPKLSLIGGILVLFSLGYTLNNLLLGVLF